ncbi:MAG: pilus assembly protein N-terminal domain-containing protein [Polyangiaceae bacterium]
MRLRALCLALAFGAYALLPADLLAQGNGVESAKPEELSLAVGETRTIPARDVKSYSVALSDIVDTRITPDGSQFVVVGKRSGRTTLLLIKNDNSKQTFAITVNAREESAVERELGQLLEGVAGVEVRRVGNRFFLEGSVGTDSELGRIHQLAALYPGQVESLVTVGGGTASDRKLLVRVDFFFLQYETNSSYSVGLGWPSAIGGDAFVQNTFSYDFIAGTTSAAQASVVNHPLPRLDIASRKGWAKVLRQASMLTANGMEANFESGGEQNFSVNTGLTIGLQRISFGTLVTVLPRYNKRSEQIDIKLVSDISDLTAAVSSSIPGRTFSRLTTNVSLKLGQGLVLSGLRAQTHTHGVAGIPGLSSIPLIGILFGSHSDNQLDTENAMLIIPSVVETIPASSLKLVDTALKEFSAFRGDLEGVAPFDTRPPSAR